MAKVKFYYDFKKDAWSWVVIVKARKKIEQLKMNWKKQVVFIPPKLLNLIKKKSRKTAENSVQKYLKSRPQKTIRDLIIKTQLIFLEKVWRKIEKRFFERLEKITGQPIFIKEFKCYLTTGFMCPYNPKDNSFMVSIWHSLPLNLTTICHEIFHLQFLHYFKKYCRKFISKRGLDDLKEAITFILNTDFNDLLLVQDKGYLAHQKLRKELKKIWKKEKNFNKFLDKAIGFIKK